MLRSLPPTQSKSLVALFVLAATFLLGVIVLLGMLNERQHRTAQSVREDALWATYQLDRDTTKLDQALAAAEAEAGEPDAKSLEAISLRFDVLFSQMKLVNTGDFLDGVAVAARFGEAFSRIRSVVLDLAPVFDRFQDSGKASRSDLAAVHVRVSGLRRETEELLTFTNARMNELRADLRSEEQRLSLALGGAIFVLLLIMIGVVLLLIRQIRAEANGRQEVERLAASLKDSALAAEAGNRAKSAFLAAVGHEIRTPLNGIVGMAEMIRQTQLDADQRHCLDIVSDCSATLIELIEGILDYSKFESGEFPVSPVEFNPADLTRSALAAAEPRAKLRGNTLSFTINPHMPEACLADPGRVRQVLGNLIGNAVKFTERGEVGVHASFAKGPRGSRLRFEVRDSGIGIPPDAHDKIFREFSQVDASISRKYGGNGLGLSICKRVVDHLGGDIGFESQPGQGSVFWFEIPASEASMKAPRPPAERPIRCASILVVEDNPVNREVAYRILSSLGQDVTVAEDGAAGVEAVRRQRFDLVLMDVQMPGMDGLQTTREIRKMDGAASLTKIIALTASASNDDREACMEAGMNGFLSKPITLSQVHELLAGTLPALEAPAPAPVAAAASTARPAAQIDQTPTFDPERVAELTDVLGADDFAELVGHFLADATDLIQQLEAAESAGDREKTKVLLHTLRGAALNCGCKRIGDLCAKARAGQSKSTSVDFRRELERARAEVEPV